MQTFISPFTDMSFKRLFGQEESKALMIDFLNSVVGDGYGIHDITYLDKEYLPSENSGRAMVYDIVCRTDCGEYIVVEMQRRKHKAFMDRVVCYLSRLVERQTKKGRGTDRPLRKRGADGKDTRSISGTAGLQEDGFGMQYSIGKMVIYSQQYGKD